MESAHDEASKVNAESGGVLVDGPGGVNVSLSPEAAAETSDRLLIAAAKARGQQIQADDKRRHEERRAQSQKE